MLAYEVGVLGYFYHSVGGNKRSFFNFTIDYYVACFLIISELDIRLII